MAPSHLEADGISSYPCAIYLPNLALLYHSRMLGCWVSCRHRRGIETQSAQVVWMDGAGSLSFSRPFYWCLQTR